MTRTSILACRDALGRHWQLGPLPPSNGRLTLLGWSQIPRAHDGGVPKQVAHVLAAALASVARVTFLTSARIPGAPNIWSPLGDDMECALEKGVIRRGGAALTGTPSRIGLVSTRRHQTVMEMFDDPGFPWWLQGMVALFSASEEPPVDIRQDVLLQLLGDEWTTHSASLASIGVQGVMRPGVDGDVAGLLSLTDAFERDVLAAFEREARRADADWAILSESAFEARL